MDRHPLLERQIKSFHSVNNNSYDHLLDEISDVYYQHEKTLNLLERALDLTSEELLSDNEEMERELHSLRGMHAQMEQLLTLFNSSMESSTDGILLLDSKGDLVFFNEKAPIFLGTISETLDAINYDSLLKLLTEKVKDVAAFAKQIEQIWHNPNIETHCTLEFHDGRVLNCCSRPYEDKSEQKGMGRIWNFHDITALIQREREAQYHALYDPITGLPNRVLFLNKLKFALLQNQRKKGQLALMFLDLDGFKHINDNMGHQIGNQLLKSATQRLCESIRESDLLGHQGGDKFLLLLNNIDKIDNICMVAEKILHAIKQPFYINDKEIFLSISIGITLHPDDALDPDALIRNANMSMYQAKKQGRDNYQFFSKELIDQSSKQLRLQNKLNHALDAGEFSLAFQPILDMKSKSVVGAECLLRWKTREGENIPPSEFIPIAEECGLIIPMTEWIIAGVCEQINLWQKSGLPKLIVSLNISGIHFKKGQLVQSLKTYISMYNIQPAQICIEVTESAIIDDLKSSAEVLQTILDNGIKVAIDDFGTGYSSFDYLKKLPINTVKIDHSFINEIDESKRDYELVKSIISISHTLNLDVIAEGVETTVISNVLENMGCDRVQGSLYSKPLDSNTFFEFVKFHTAQ